jgi:hypothetical protein
MLTPNSFRAVCALLTLSFSNFIWAVDVQVTTITEDKDPVIRGGVVTYTIPVLNADNDSAPLTTLTIPLPTGAVVERAQVRNPFPGQSCQTSLSIDISASISKSGSVITLPISLMI